MIVLGDVTAFMLITDVMILVAAHLIIRRKTKLLEVEKHDTPRNLPLIAPIVQFSLD